MISNTLTAKRFERKVKEVARRLGEDLEAAEDQARNNFERAMRRAP